MKRTFFVKAEGLPEMEMTGNFSYGRLDALRDYAKQQLPGWTVLSGGILSARYGEFLWWAAEAVNTDATQVIRLWAKEPF